MSSNDDFDRIINRAVIRAALRTVAYSTDRELRKKARQLLLSITNDEKEFVPFNLWTSKCDGEAIIDAIKDINDIKAKRYIAEEKKKTKINRIIKNRKFFYRIVLKPLN